MIRLLGVLAQLIRESRNQWYSSSALCRRNCSLPENRGELRNEIAGACLNVPNLALPVSLDRISWPWPNPKDREVGKMDITEHESEMNLLLDFSEKIKRGHSRLPFLTGGPVPPGTTG